MDKLNIANLLKDCPKGMELDCTMYDSIYFDGINNSKEFPINIGINTTGTWCSKITLDKYGRPNSHPNAKCIIFPKGKTTWEGFQKPFKDGDVVRYLDSIAIFKEWGDETLFRTYVTAYLHGDSTIDISTPLFGKFIKRESRFATEEEKQKLFDAIKANGYKWNPETKTLEELIPNKFDITTLKPFEKVLVRLRDTDHWKPAFWGKRIKNDNFPFITSYGSTAQTIPFKGNEWLIGTTDDCDDFYKTWK